MNYQGRTIIAILLLVLMTPLLFASDGVFRSVSGRVEYQIPGDGWRAASVGTRIPTGALISTSFRSEATLEIDSAVLTVRPLTRMRIDELVEKEGGISTELHLRVGRVRAEVKKVEGLQNNFRLTSPVSTAAVRGTSFDYDGVNLQVLTGLVRFANSFGVGATLSAGERGVIQGNGAPLSGADARELEMLVFLQTLPSFSEYESLISAFTGPVSGIEYGSIGGTVQFPAPPLN